MAAHFRRDATLRQLRALGAVQADATIGEVHMSA
jgi:hypothetical protein